MLFLRLPKPEKFYTVELEENSSATLNGGDVSQGSQSIKSTEESLPSETSGKMSCKSVNDTR